MSLWTRGGRPQSADFSALIAQSGEKAFNFALRLSGSEAEARDLVAEAFVNAYEKWEGYDQSRPFEAWLLRILHNIYVDGIRRDGLRRAASLDAPVPESDASWDEILPGSDPEPGFEMVRRQTEENLKAALESLPVHYRTAVVLCDIEGLPYEDIARVMACPVGTVRSRIHQGREMIRRFWRKLESPPERQSL